MRWPLRALAWIYDFLAEDLVLLIGTALAVGIAVLAIHTVRDAAGVILYGVIVGVIAVSLWRAVSHEL
jgi:hypothetical protein